MRRKQDGFAHIAIPVTVVLLVGISVVGYRIFSNKHSANGISNVEKSKCKPASAGLFTSDITNISNINVIQTPIRLIGGNNIKTHSFVGVAKRSPIYSPMDATLNAGANYRETMGFSSVTKIQYLLTFNEGCDVSFWLDHVVDVPEKIKAAFPAEPRNDTKAVKVKNIEIKAGELVGYSNQEGPARFDFGAINLKGPETSLTTNPRFKDNPIVKTSNKYRYATCPYNLYDSAKQKVYQSLYSSIPDGDQEIIDNICD